jgi:hypothetical protein
MCGAAQHISAAFTMVLLNITDALAYTYPGTKISTDTY